MLIIGHRGAKGLAPENTLAALQAGVDAGADMLECDVRLTKDHQLVIIHDSRLMRTHRQLVAVSGLTLAELQERTPDMPVPTLKEALDAYFGKIILNIEIKSRGAGKAVVALLAKDYITRPQDWDTILLSSFHVGELRSIRRTSRRANIALLHRENPFTFIAFERSLRLSAVGFHRLTINSFALDIAHRIGLFTYVYTVNRPEAALRLEAQGVDGIVTNYPDILVEVLNNSN